MLACRLAILVAALFASGCAGLLRATPTPFPVGTREACPWAMSRELLGATDRIVFVVERVRGHSPEPAALDHLARVASRYAERPASWIAVGQVGAPRVAWEGPDRPRLLDGLDPRASYVFVRYTGEGDGGLGYFGRSTEVVTDGAQRRLVYVIDVAQEHHRALAFLWLREPQLEAQTLVHEYGHLLGLPSPDHGFFRGYPSFEGGAHCVNPDCPLTLPTPRAILYGLWRTGLTFRFLDDYCAECRRTIAEAKRWFREHPPNA